MKQMKPRLKLKFVDTYRGWKDDNNLFSNVLSEHYDLEFTDEPDILFFLPFGTEHLKYRCRKVFVTGENVRPDFHVCDYAFSFDYLDDPRNYRLPLSLWGNVQKPVDFDAAAELAKKTKFCNFLFSNPSCPIRNDLFEKLSRYKRVEAGGRCKNNLGYRVADKRSFLADFKFTIAYENTTHPGYLTEKITDAFAANTIPIYWGDPLVHRDFNPASFINYYDHGSNEAVIERIMELDQDDDAYLEMMRQPRYTCGEFPEFAAREQIQTRLRQIIDADETPVATTSQRMWHRVRHRAHHKKHKWSRRLARWRYRALPA